MSELKSKTIKSVRWTTLNTVGLTIVYFIQIAVVARLLGPKEIGLMAIANLFIGYAHIFLDFGLSSAIIQRPNPTQHELSTLYWINVLTGFLVYVILVLFTPLIAAIFRIDELRAILPVIGIQFIISAFSAQFSVLLRKYLRFDVSTKISLSRSLLVMTLTILLALKGFGVWALIYGSLCGTIFHSIILVLWAYKTNNLPRLHFRLADTNGYLSFGLYRIGAMLVNRFNSRMDQLVIGLLIGPTALGYYNIAFNLVIQPIHRINPILTKVAFPIFSSIQNDAPRLKNGFLQMMRILMCLNAPAMIGLVCVAPVAVPLLVGPQWIPAVPIVQVLAIFSLFRSALNAGGSLVIAKGKANWTLYWNLSLAAIVPLVIVIASFGDEVFHIAVALTVMQAFLWFAHYYIFIRNLIGPCFKEYSIILLKPVLISLIMGAVVLHAAYYFTGSAEIEIFLIQVTIGIAVYGVLCWFFQKEFLHRLVEFFFGSFPDGKDIKNSTNMSTM